MEFTVLTIFPDMFQALLGHGIIRKAISLKKINVTILNIRDFAPGPHRVTDDTPYGGGCGMVMKPEPLASAIREAKHRACGSKTILLTPQGRVFTQDIARSLLTFDGLILVCGRYEGVDERIRSDFVDFEISIGDYVLTGGELAAMVIIDAVTRLIPGTLGGADSAGKDSFSDYLIEHAHYTKPRTFEGQSVPEVLLSGHHQEIEKWRLESSLIRTFLKRKDLLERRALSRQEIDILKKWRFELENIIHSQSVRSPDTLSGSQ
ncbi:MAG: tRNA (guanosine(37)-N1)-methyltransferase TrmD [Deltaproteobacteria bacterium]|nr:tRNA (guanosine(37)-N1)-methyltransferase TrmD [Deltaproteobacteria bacterium]